MDRNLDLIRTPKWTWKFTCRDRRDFPQRFDSQRLMDVCTNCNLPDANNGQIYSDCISCGNVFIVWQVIRPMPDLCGNCGGTNFAEPGKRTPNIFAEED